MRDKVAHIPNYGDVSIEEVANMNPVDIAELEMFVNSTVKNDLCNLLHEGRLLTAEEFNMRNVYYAPIASGRVNVLMIPIRIDEKPVFISNMTVQDMLSKCTRWQGYPMETTNADINAKRAELARGDTNYKLHS